MKRSTPLRTHGIRSSDPFNNLSIDQLAYIGAVAMLFNDLESEIDEMCAKCVAPDIQPREIVGRINGLDGKVGIIKHAAKQWGFDESEMQILEDTLGQGEGFQGLKGLRDGVVHARVFDMTTSVARTRGRHGKVADVLLAIDALKGLYRRMEEMRVELDFIGHVLGHKQRIKKGGIADPHKARLEEEILTYWSLALVHRSQRLSLPPMPEFPADTLNVGQLRRVLADTPLENP